MLDWIEPGWIFGEKEKGKERERQRERKKIDKARWALTGEYGGGDGRSWVFPGVGGRSGGLFFEHEYFKDGRIVKVLSDSKKGEEASFVLTKVLV